MKILLRNKQTGLFYEEKDRWTPERSRAHCFHLEERVIERAFDQCLRDVELIYEFPNPEMNFQIAVTLFRALGLQSRTV